MLWPAQTLCDDNFSWGKGILVLGPRTIRFVFCLCILAWSGCTGDPFSAGTEGSASTEQDLAVVLAELAKVNSALPYRLSIQEQVPDTNPEQVQSRRRILKANLEELGKGSLASHGKALMTLLLDGKSREFLNQARRQFEERLYAGSQTWEILNDAAVCHLLYYDAIGDPHSLYRALVLLLAAEAQAPDRPLVLFNLTHAKAKAGLRRGAALKWQQLQELAHDTAWQARHHFPFPREPLGLSETFANIDGDAQLRAKALKSASMARLLIENLYLPRWGRGDDAALQLARPFAESLREKDTMLLETIESIEAATGEQRAQLRRAFAFYARGLAEKANSERASAHFQAAEALLEQQDHPFTFRARYYRLLNSSLKPGDKLAQYSALLEEAKRLKYKNLVGETLWVRGNTAYNLHGPRESREDSRQALEYFSAIDDGENIAGAHFMLGANAAYLMDSSRGWSEYLVAMEQADQVLKPKRMNQIYSLGMYSAWQNGDVALALAFLEEVMPHGMANGDANTLANNHLWLARIHQQLGSFKKAKEALNRAKVLAQEVDGDSGKRLAIDILIVTAMVTEKSQERVDALKRALDTVLEGEILVQEIMVRHALARAFLELDQQANAEKQLRHAVEKYRQYEPRLHDDGQYPFFGGLEGIYDLLTGLQMKDDRINEALKTYLAKRARVLQNRIKLGLLFGPEIEEIPWPEQDWHWRRLPEGTGLVVYGVVDQRLVAWTMKADSVEPSFLRLDLELPFLTQEIEDYIKQSQQSQAMNEDLITWLYEKVLAPPLEELGEIERLVVVTDGPLHALPLDGLMVGYGREILPIVHTPSPAVYELCRQRAEILKDEESSLLIVAATEPDPEYHPYLPAGREYAKTIKKAWGKQGRVKLLKGDQATIQRFREEAPNYRYILFIGHGEVDHLTPDYSRLFFNPDSNGESILHAHQMADFDFAKTQLVALAGCETGAGPRWGGEGIQSLARAFFARQVPTLVGSLTKMRDDNPIMVHLFAELGNGQTPGEAMRAAKLMVMGRPGSPSADWSMIQLMGADHN